MHNLGDREEVAGGGAGVISEGGVTGAPPGRGSKSCAPAGDGRKRLGACRSKKMLLGGRWESNGPEMHGEGHRVYKCGWARIRWRRGVVANPMRKTTGTRCEACGSQGGPKEDLEVGNEAL